MRILWLSSTNGLFQQVSSSSYSGGGWISSLQQIVMKEKEIQLGFAFLSNQYSQKEYKEGVTYYPIHVSPKTKIAKLKGYYGGYKYINEEEHVSKIHMIIQDFNPDIIHLFGIESKLATILGKTQIPVVVHLQGLLAPYDNAFFPVNINRSSFLFPFSINEWIMRNGYIHAKNIIHIRGEREKKLFKKVNYTMGRTNWDYQVSSFLAPNSKYFHVNEVLRNPFYQKAGLWQWNNKNNKMVITSTLSNTIYKGLDLILKTAQLLKSETKIDFQWNIIGIPSQAKIIHFFERTLHIKSKDVNIHYQGVLSANELCEVLLKSHVYVHPSYIDNSPNSLCEAQLLGLPVIGTYVGGIPSLIQDYENGILVPANAPFELAFHLKKLYNNKELANTIGRQAYLTANQRHDREKIITSLKATYQTIINKCH